MNRKSVNSFRYRFLLFAFLLHSFSIVLFSQKINVGFDSGEWDKSRAKVVEHLGKQGLMGTAFLSNVQLKNGIVEVDIAGTERVRSYPGILFRIKDPFNYERVYIRPHRSPYYDDALQYAPVFNGVDSWQLYNGPGKTASLDILPEKWNHLKIVIAGDQARIFWNDEQEPALIIENLEFGISGGSLGLSGPMDGSAYFADFSYEIIDTLQLPDIVHREPICGIIKKWDLSEVIPFIGADFTKYPDNKILSGLKWESILADDEGLVDISKHYGRKSRVGDCIFAKTTVTAKTDTLLRVGFGYSDFITVYLNKKPLFLGVSSYRSRDKSFLGIVGYFDNLFLPLKKGSNELLLLIGETMGGWGFCFRNEDEIYIDQSLTNAWKLKDSLSLPESVVYDPRNDVCYVSNYFNEGNEYISKISPEGEVIDKVWVGGLRMPTGMSVYKNHLYAVDRTGLVKIDIEKKEIVEKILLTGSQMPNDVAISQDGAIYISDTPGNSVFRYDDGILEKWVENLDNPNGLLAEGDKLLVGQNGKVIAINTVDKSAKVFTEIESIAQIDGIQSDGNGNYLISDYHGIVYLVTPDGKNRVLLNSSTPGIYTADFAYIQNKKLMLIPGMYDNSVTAYKIK